MNLLNPLEVTEVFRDDLEAVFSHLVPGQVHSSDPFDAKQDFNFLRALFPDAVAAKFNHLEAAHVDNPAQQLSKSILAESLHQVTPTYIIPKLRGP